MTEPEMKYVDSSSIEAIGYDAEAHDLWVRFISDRMYVYSDVPPAIFDNIMRADSKGRYFNREIKPNYPYRPV